MTNRAFKYIALFLLLGLCLAARPAHGQALGGNEYVAGAGLNIALRGPYIDKGWRRPVPRFVLGAAISHVYEEFIDVNYGRPGHTAWRDEAGRLCGYLLTEAVVSLAKKVL